MNQTIGYALAAASVVLATGCGDSKSLDIGDGKHSTAALGASLADYAGKWDGHAEAYEFFDGSDRVRLSIDEDGTGVLEVGDAPALPAPNPEVGYPADAFGGEKGGFNTPQLGFYPGFEYPIDGANVESKRIRFKALTREVFREWCELQTPGLNVGSFPESYSCAPGGFSSMWDGSADAQCTTGADATPINCGKATLCGTVCTCDQDSCSIYDETDSQFDAVLQAEGEELEGTLVIAGERVVVRMTRQ